ncbi:hypothetical protein ACJ41O_006279 [Fusarium nematophilum]
MAALTDTQTLALLERLGGSISLVAVLFIFITYAVVVPIRNPRNTFIMFASIANLGASIACIIARDGIYPSGRGIVLTRDGSNRVCLRFMQSDAWWSFGMSFNTFRVVSGRTNPNSFNKSLYSLVCFGGPFATAFPLFFISTPSRGPVYGETFVWCWIRDEWADIRVFTSYIFVWACIIASVVLNSIVGYRIFRTRNEIRNFSNSHSQQSGGDEQLSGPPTRPKLRGSAYPIVVTEVSITHAPASMMAKPSPTFTNSTMRSSGTSAHEQMNRYSSIITSPNAGEQVPKIPRILKATKRVVAKFRLQDPVKRAYLRTTFLFTLSVLVSWIPASINRIHSMQGSQVPYPYQVTMVAVMPLQGLWNAIIFFVTSRKVLREWARGKWGFWPLGPAALTGEVERNVEEANMNYELDPTDSGSDIELRQVSRLQIKRIRREIA